MARPYAEIEKYLPVIVRAELQKQDDTYRHLFAEEFSKKRRSLGVAYFCALIFFTSHRWYLGKPWMTVLQWLAVMCLIGIPWVILDWFRLPGMCRERNAEIAKSVLAEQKILTQ